MLEYWTVKVCSCWDRISNESVHCFETEEEAMKYYNDNKEEFRKRETSIYKPEKVTIVFDKEKTEVEIENYRQKNGEWEYANTEKCLGLWRSVEEIINTYKKQFERIAKLCGGGHRHIVKVKGKTILDFIEEKRTRL